VKQVGWVNLVLAVLVAAVMAPAYGLVQGIVMGGLVLVILVGYDRLARRHLGDWLRNRRR
jgi:hypothetical protein